MVDVTCHMCDETREQSPEHHFPKWMRKYLPIGNTKSFNLATGVQWNKSVGVRTIMGICKVCNEGWMSRLQEEAKPTIASIIQNKKLGKLDKVKSDTIAKWFAMFTMVFEKDNPSSQISISKEERIKFSNDQVVGDGWIIYIGTTKRGGTDARGVSHLPAAVIAGSGTHFNYQSTIAQFGSLICLSRSGQAPYTDETFLQSWGMTKVWPATDGVSSSMLPRFPQRFHPRILSDVLDGRFTNPKSAEGFPLGLRGYFPPPPGLIV